MSTRCLILAAEETLGKRALAPRWNGRTSALAFRSAASRRLSADILKGQVRSNVALDVNA